MNKAVIIGPIVVLDKTRENPGEIDWSQVEKLGKARIYDDTP